jgi:hypothetical protein
MLTLNKYGSDHSMTFELGNYTENGNLYVGIISHDEGYPVPWQNLTVNLSVECAPNRAYIDTNNNGNEIIFWLVENGLGDTTGNMLRSGWCMYPEFEFNMDELMKHVTEDYRIGDGQ